MVKNPHYWEAGKPRLDGVTIEILPEDNSRVLKLKAGELDAIIGIPFNQVDGLKTDPNVAVGVVNAFRTDLVQLNTTRSRSTTCACARRSTTPSTRGRSCRTSCAATARSRTRRCR